MYSNKGSKKHESNSVLQAELEFKARARCNKRLGQWLAKEMGLDGVEVNDYVADVIHSDMEKPGDDDVLEKVMADVSAKMLKLTEKDVRTKMGEFLRVARAEIRDEAEIKQ